jgi:hypothetical protein
MVICHPPEFEILISTFTYAGHKQNYPPGIWKVEVFTNGYNNNIIKLSFDNEHCLWSNYQIFSHNIASTSYILVRWRWCSLCTPSWIFIALGHWNNIQSAGRYVAPLTHIILISNQPVFALNYFAACMAQKQKYQCYSVLSDLGLDPTIYRTRRTHTNQLVPTHVVYIYTRLKIKPNSVRIRSLSCQIFVLPSTGFELTPLIHCSTNRLALCPAP